MHLPPRSRLTGWARVLQRTWVLLTVLVLVRVSGDLLRLLRNPKMFTHPEEAYNATVALAIGNAGLIDQTLHMQYRAFCGGCSVVSLVGAPFMGLAGDSWLMWKLVAVLWAVATMLVAYVAVERWAGKPAAVATATLLALPIPGLQDVSLYLWGNHQESNLLILTGLALVPGAPLAAGVVAGFSLWFCRISAYGLVALLILGLVTHGWRGRIKLLAGTALGLTAFLLPAGDDYAHYHLRAQEMVPRLELGRSFTRLSELLLDAAPSYVPAFRTPELPYLLGAAVVLVAMVLIAVHARSHPRRAALLLFPALYALGWAVSPFEILGGTGVLSARYHTPWWMWWTITIGVGAGLVWERGGRQRWGSVALLLPLLLTSVWVQSVRPIHLAGLRKGYTGAREAPASDLGIFAHVAVSRLDSDRLARAHARTSDFEPSLRLLEGLAMGLEVRLGRRPLDGAIHMSAKHGLDVVRGLGAGLMGEEWEDKSTYAANQVMDDLEPDVAAALGSGLGGGLAPILLQRAHGGEELDPVATHAQLMAGATDRCHLCFGQGWLAVETCGGERARPECVERWLLEPGREAALVGVGAALAEHSESSSLLDQMGERWGPEALELLREGAQRPSVGADTAIRAPRDRSPFRGDPRDGDGRDDGPRGDGPRGDVPRGGGPRGGGPRAKKGKRRPRGESP